MNKRVQGFTLIELLIVIALIAILAGAIIIALNPARQFAQARNSQRWTHINTIMNSVQQNAADNNGVFTCAAGALPATATLMQASGGYNICGCLVPTFISSMPYDPSASGAGYTDCTTYTSGYTIMEDATTERVTVAAPDAELSETINITQ